MLSACGAPAPRVGLRLLRRPTCPGGDALTQRAWADRAFRGLARARPQDGGSEPIDALLARGDECLALIDSLVQAPVGAIMSRVHGVYLLGQVLIVQ